MKDGFTTLEKKCGCFNTASGPRLIFEGGKNSTTNPELQTATIKMVTLACDTCDAEWTPAKKKARG